MATKFKIANMCLKEHITTVQGKKLVDLINRTFKVRTGHYKLLYVVLNQAFYFKEAQKPD